MSEFRLSKVEVECDLIFEWILPQVDMNTFSQKGCSIEIEICGCRSGELRMRLRPIRARRWSLLGVLLGLTRHFVNSMVRHILYICTHIYVMYDVYIVR